MTVATAAKPMTADDLWAMPQGDTRYELVRGELRTMAPAGGGHGLSIGRLTVALGLHVRQQDLGELFGAETGFLIERDPDTVRAPDIAFVAKTQIPPDGVPEKFVPFAPTLAVEVISPSDTVYEVEEKVEDWLTAGTREVWVVSRRRRTVTIHGRGPAPVVLTATDALTGGDVLPGFSIPVVSIFD